MATTIEYKVSYVQQRFAWDVDTVYVETFNTVEYARQFKDALDKLDYITNTEIAKITTIKEVL